MHSHMFQFVLHYGHVRRDKQKGFIFFSAVIDKYLQLISQLRYMIIFHFFLVKQETSNITEIQK